MPSPRAFSIGARASCPRIEPGNPIEDILPSIWEVLRIKEKAKVRTAGRG